MLDIRQRMSRIDILTTYLCHLKTLTAFIFITFCLYSCEKEQVDFRNPFVGTYSCTRLKINCSPTYENGAWTYGCDTSYLYSYILTVTKGSGPSGLHAKGSMDDYTFEVDEQGNFNIGMHGASRLNDNSIELQYNTASGGGTNQYDTRINGYKN